MSDRTVGQLSTQTNICSGSEHFLDLGIISETMRNMNGTIQKQVHNSKMLWVQKQTMGPIQ